jgi:hypothetical protein
MSLIFSHEKGGTRRKYNAYLYRDIKFILKRKKIISICTVENTFFENCKKEKFQRRHKTEVFIEC